LALRSPRGIGTVAARRSPSRREPGRPILSTICIIAAGVIRASLPAAEFTLAWEHSVEKTRWEEHYEIDGERLRLTQARIQGFGAGMEPPAGARLVDGWWTWRPALAPLPELRLARSSYTRDYRLCWNERCATLSELVGSVGESEPVTVTSCSCP
jgi:hypothetical protein